jgi:putative NADH-flavin reductase
MIKIFLFLILASYINALAYKGKVAVVGGNGKTGSKCVNLALKGNAQVRAITRSGEYRETLPNQECASLLENYAADVKDVRGMIAALEGVDSCIFAASASKEGGTPQEIDRDGLINVAKACILNKVSRLVIVSSGAVSKPFSPVYLFLNLFGGIMKAKFQGEQEVKKLYSLLEEEEKGKLSFTVVRPGGLTEEEPLGVTGLELNQDDAKSGRISRWDVASLCLESLASSSAENTIYECYNKDTASTLSSVFGTNFLKLKKEVSDTDLGEFERRGETFPEIFVGLKKAI